jgi:hypothetical protein
MPNLETIVRPFVAEPFGGRSLVPVGPAGPGKPNIVVSWGNPSTLQAKAIGVKDLNTGKFWTEQDRKTSRIRVHNPSDSSQFVDIDRIDSIHLQDEKGNDHFMTLNNPASE